VIVEPVTHSLVISDDGYLDLVLAAMDAPTLASFRAHYVSRCPAAVTQPTILRIIDRHLAAR